MTLQLATGLWVFQPAIDAYCVEGYRDSIRITDIFAAINKMKIPIKGIEIRQTDITPEMPVKEMKKLLKDQGLNCSCVAANLCFTRKFALGGFGNQHQKTRSAAIEEGRKAVDIARALGATEVTLRLYTDGYDYPFQVDYVTQWNTIISSIKTIAKYAAGDVNIAVAYKPREPRKRLSIATVGKALSMCQEIAMKNVGVAFTFSHALMAGENPAESIAFLHRSGKLFQVYFNDCHGMWDDAMMPGSLHLWETLEALFYLKTAKYSGYVTIDIVPPRMDPASALQIAAGNLAVLWKKVEKIDIAEMRKIQKTMDATESQKAIRRALLL